MDRLGIIHLLTIISRILAAIFMKNSFITENRLIVTYLGFSLF